MPAEPGAEAGEGTQRGPDKLSIIVFSGEFERIHYAFAMASAAADRTPPVTLFSPRDR